MQKFILKTIAVLALWVIVGLGEHILRMWLLSDRERLIGDFPESRIQAWSVLFAYVWTTACLSWWQEWVFTKSQTGLPDGTRIRESHNVKLP